MWLMRLLYLRQWTGEGAFRRAGLQPGHYIVRTTGGFSR
jgi:hypothetical protein